MILCGGQSVLVESAAFHSSTIGDCTAIADQVGIATAIRKEVDTLWQRVPHT